MFFPASGWFAASLLLGVVLAACANTPVTTTTPGPTATLSSPTASPAASASTTMPTPVPTPTARPEPLPSPTIAASGLPAGWQHELVCREDRYSGCELHLHDAAGRDRPGWPTPLLAGWCEPENVAVGTDGVAYVACTTDDERIVVSSFAVTGSPRPGWPVGTRGGTGPGKNLFVGPDGTVFVSTITAVDDREFAIHAFTPDGRPLAGWPQPLPGVGQGFTLAPDGTVVGWWYEGPMEETLDLQAARTKFTMIGLNGRTLAGWPITSIRTATAPVVTKDGSIFYTSATGKVWGHDRRGNILDGWPYRLPYKVAPELRPDGRLMFIVGDYVLADGTTPDSQVIVLTTTGRMASGWPYQTRASLDGVRCCADCGSYFPHAVSADGTLYLAPWTDARAEVVALDRRGRVVTGWPYRLSPGSRVVALEMGSARRLVVSLRDCSAQHGCCNDEATREITLTPTGELAP